MLTARQKGDLARALDNLVDAADDHAFIGTIPYDEGAGLAARQELINSLANARKRVENLVARWVQP